MQSISGNFATTSAALEAAQPTFWDDSATLEAAQPTLWDDSAGLQAPGEAEVLHCRRKSGVQEPRDPHFVLFYLFLFFFIIFYPFLCFLFFCVLFSPSRPGHPHQLTHFMCTPWSAKSDQEKHSITI